MAVALQPDPVGSGCHGVDLVGEPGMATQVPLSVGEQLGQPGRPNLEPLRQPEISSAQPGRGRRALQVVGTGRPGRGVGDPLGAGRRGLGAAGDRPDRRGRPQTVGRYPVPLPTARSSPAVRIYRFEYMGVSRIKVSSGDRKPTPRKPRITQIDRGISLCFTSWIGVLVAGHGVHDPGRSRTAAFAVAGRSAIQFCKAVMVGRTGQAGRVRRWAPPTGGDMTSGGANANRTAAHLAPPLTPTDQ